MWNFGTLKRLASFLTSYKQKLSCTVARFHRVAACLSRSDSTLIPTWTKIRKRRQRTDNVKWSFVNRTNRLCNRLPAEILGTLHCKPNTLERGLGKWSMWWSEGIGSVLKIIWKGSEVKWSEGKWSEEKWRGGKSGRTVKGIISVVKSREVKITLKLVCNTCGETILGST